MIALLPPVSITVLDWHRRDMPLRGQHTVNEAAAVRQTQSVEPAIFVGAAPPALETVAAAGPVNGLPYPIYGVLMAAPIENLPNSRDVLPVDSPRRVRALAAYQAMHRLTQEDPHPDWTQV